MYIMKNPAQISYNRAAEREARLAELRAQRDVILEDIDKNLQEKWDKGKTLVLSLLVADEEVIPLVEEGARQQGWKVLVKPRDEYYEYHAEISELESSPPVLKSLTRKM